MITLFLILACTLIFGTWLETLVISAILFVAIWYLEIPEENG